MTTTTFTTEERVLLQELLKKKLDCYHNEQSSNDKFSKKHIKSLASAIDKISKNEAVIYKNEEKSVCNRCINERYSNFYSELQLPTASSWLTISDEQINVVRKLDICKDILFKCGYYKKTNAHKRYDIEFRYQHILSTVDKLKKSNKVFLSKQGQNDFYKIAFVYEDKEYFCFELNQQVTLRDAGFASLHGQSPEDIANKKFSMITTKQKAKELLANCNSADYPDGVIDFMNTLLN